MKSLIKYRGGKSNEIPNIEKHIPRYDGRLNSNSVERVG
jgi:site-specific DNA-adenine methylase